MMIMNWKTTAIMVFGLVNGLDAQERIYSIGNSLTADSRPTIGLVGLAAARGMTIDVGTHIQCGASLVSIVGDPETTCATLPHGHWPVALAAGGYDAVLLQPYPQPDVSALRELEAWRTLATVARTGSADCALWVYAAWPRLPAGFSEAWEADWTDPNLEMATNRGFFVWALSELQRDFPNVGIVPVGDVIERLDNRLKTSPVAELNSGLDFYRDIHHLSNLGRYVASVTVYAHVFNADPRGLPVPDGFSSASGENNVVITPELAAIVQDAVADVWLHRPYQHENLPTDWHVSWVENEARVSLRAFLGHHWTIETSTGLREWQSAVTVTGDGRLQVHNLPMTAFSPHAGFVRVVYAGVFSQTMQLKPHPEK